MIEQNQLEEVRKLKEGLINKLKLFQLSTVAIVEANSEPSVRFGRLQKSRRNLADSLLRNLPIPLYLDTGRPSNPYYKEYDSGHGLEFHNQHPEFAIVEFRAHWGYSSFVEGVEAARARFVSIGSLME